MKRVVWMAACFFMPLSAHAQVTADRAFAQCGTIADANARLACYDAARDQSKATHWPEFGATPQPSQAQPAPVQPAPRAAARAPVTSSDSKLVARVAQFSFSPHGQFTVVLDNGEIWRQLESDDGIAHFKHSSGDIVQISKGFWGSYDLRVNSSNIMFKVIRVR